LNAGSDNPKKAQPMIDWHEYAAFYIERLRGPESENAYHSLIEADDAIIPILIDAFRTEPPGFNLMIVPLAIRPTASLKYPLCRQYRQLVDAFCPANTFSG
jgi:hypothetical protein